jgi:hypothetical protein
MESLILLGQADIPILSEYAQYGVIGICIALIILVGYITKIYLNAIINLYAKIETLTGSITTLTAKIDSMSFIRRRKLETLENPDE